MIKKFLQRLGLIRPTDPKLDEHIVYTGDHVSLQRKNYPTKELTPTEEYALYSDLAWCETYCLLPHSESKGATIYKSAITIEEAVKLLQQGYTPCPF